MATGLGGFHRGGRRIAAGEAGRGLAHAAKRLRAACRTSSASWKWAREARPCAPWFASARRNTAAKLAVSLEASSWAAMEALRRGDDGMTFADIDAIVIGRRRARGVVMHELSPRGRARRGRKPSHRVHHRRVGGRVQKTRSTG